MKRNGAFSAWRILALTAAVVVIVLAFIAPLAPAAEVKVSGTKIDMPAPMGFTEVRPISKRAFDLFQAMFPPGHHLLEVFVSDEDAENLRSGRPPEMASYMMVSSDKKLEGKTTTSGQFAVLRRILRTEHDKLFEKNRKVIDECVDNAGRTLSEKMSTDVGFKVNTAVPLGIDEETSSSITMSQLTTYRMSTGDNSSNFTVAYASTTTLVKGKVLYLYVYRKHHGDEDVEWTRSRSKQWLERIRGANGVVEVAWFQAFLEHCPEWSWWGNLFVATGIASAIGLTVPLLIRFVFLRRPISKGASIPIALFFLVVNIVFVTTVTGSGGTTAAAVGGVAVASCFVLNLRRTGKTARAGASAAAAEGTFELPEKLQEPHPAIAAATGEGSAQPASQPSVPDGPSEPNAQASPSAKSARGIVAGGVLTLVVGMMFLGPIVNTVRIYRGFEEAEAENPVIGSLELWRTYKTATWLAFAGFTALGVYAGYGLARSRQRSVVRRAKWILWINNPGACLVTNLLIPFIVFGVVLANPEFVGLLVGSVVNAAIWTAYLSKSKRVRAAYGYDRPAPGVA